MAVCAACKGTGRIKKFFISKQCDKCNGKGVKTKTKHDDVWSTYSITDPASPKTRSSQSDSQDSSCDKDSSSSNSDSGGSDSSSSDGGSSGD